MSRKHRIHLGDDVRDIAHAIGDFVYLRTRDEPIRGQIVGFIVTPGQVLYSVCWGPDATERRHYDFELSTSPFVQDTTDNDSPETEE